MKKIIIKQCKDCLFIRELQTSDYTHKCVKQQKQFYAPNDGLFPKWCPLEDN
jgi:hypothetical protein